MKDLTPRKIVAELDKYIVAQDDAKRAVAIAVRNRWRRQQLPSELRDEVAPKNIIMIGSTGVGKTEIARRLAGLVGAPFLKVEASRYTEVGYYGRDVESMIRDLTDMAWVMVRTEAAEQVYQKAAELAEEQLLDLVVPPVDWSGSDETERAARREKTRNTFREKLGAGKLDDRSVEISVEEKAQPVQVLANVGLDQMGPELQDMLDKILPKGSRTRRVTVAEARRILTQQEADKLIDREGVTRETVERVENMGIIFIDELDKVAGRETGHGPDVSREGVQRDLLPIVEGTTVQTKHGIVHTDHILFIAAGAFHVSKPSDLIPEMQGRFPIRVELKDLTEADFLRILTEPQNALTRQYVALMETEGVKVKFEKSAIREIARVAAEVNGRMQNIGARRLHTVMERLFEEISFEAPDMQGVTVKIDAAYVERQLAEIVKDEDLSRYIL
ncbi:MAG TPA: ATP-dependent protease ATPase subunit HslU [Planctomycetota bacterium]|nr:ATP-dependent protease ATPase subunit HslU [Planctomycetota bacterium]